jgi:hypothetical protein
VGTLVKSERCFKFEPLMTEVASVLAWIIKIMYSRNTLSKKLGLGATEFLWTWVI